METAFILCAIAVALAVVWLFLFYKRNKNSNSMGPPKSEEQDQQAQEQNLSHTDYTTANSLDGSLSLGSYREQANYTPQHNLSNTLGHSSRGYSNAFDDEFRSQNVTIPSGFMEDEYVEYQRHEQPQRSFGYQGESIVNEELSHYQTRGRNRLDSLEQDFEFDLATSLSSLSGVNLSSEESLSPAYVESNSTPQFGVNHLSHLTEEQRNQELTYAQEQRFAQGQDQRNSHLNAQHTEQGENRGSNPLFGSNKHINLDQGKNSYLNSSSLKQGFKPTGPRIPVNSTANTLTADEFPYSDRTPNPAPQAQPGNAFASAARANAQAGTAQAKNYSSQAELMREMQSQRQQNNLGSGQKTAPWNQNAGGRSAPADHGFTRHNLGAGAATSTATAQAQAGQQAPVNPQAQPRTQAQAAKETVNPQPTRFASPANSASASPTPAVQATQATSAASQASGAPQTRAESKPIAAPTLNPMAQASSQVAQSKAQADSAKAAPSEMQEILKMVQSLGLEPEQREALLQQLLKSKQETAAKKQAEVAKAAPAEPGVQAQPAPVAPEQATAKKGYSGLELKRYHEKDLKIRKLIETAYPGTKHENMLVFKITSRMPESGDYFKNLLVTLKHKIPVIDILPGLVTSPNRTRVVLKPPPKRAGSSVKKFDPVTVCHLYKSDLRGFSETEFEPRAEYNELFVCIPASMVQMKNQNIENQIIRLMQLLKESRAYLQGTLSLRGTEIPDSFLNLNQKFLRLVNKIIDDTTIDIPHN